MHENFTYVMQEVARKGEELMQEEDVKIESVTLRKTYGGKLRATYLAYNAKDGSYARKFEKPIRRK